jgi:hypothetical protein
MNQRAQFGFLDDIVDAVEDVAEFVEDAGGTIGNIVKHAAPFIAMIPGVGTLAGAAIYAVGAVAAGDRISDVAINSVEGALPAEARGLYRKGIDIGYQVGRGANIKNELIAAGREEARLQGGAPAVAAYDTGIAIGQGRGLQDAGFQVMGAWVAGNTAGERAVLFAKDAAEAARTGKSLEDFLVDAGAHQLIESIPLAKQGQALAAAIQYFLNHPEELLDHSGYVKDYLDIYDMAERAGIPASALRSAITIVLQMIDGKILVIPSTRRLDRVNHVISMAAIEAGGFAVAETAKAANDTAAARGQTIINSGATWAPIDSPVRASLFDIRNKYRDWTTTIKHTTRYDPVSGVTVKENWTEVRSDTVNDTWRRGFDVGIGVCEGASADGPGQQKARASLTLLAAQYGFDAAQAIQFDRTKKAAFTKGITAMASRVVSAADRTTLEGLAIKGQNIARDPMVAAARALNPDPRFRWGFDIGSATCQGSSIPGPGQDATRAKLSPLTLGGGLAYNVPSTDPNARGSNEAMQGFDVAQALQHGITKTGSAQVGGSPSTGAGTLIANGLSGSTNPGDVKAAVAQTTFADPSMKQAVATTLSEKKGFIAKVLEFFGF